MDDKSPKGICPYYKRETAQMIICTGIVPNSDLESGFASVKAKRNHKKIYCEGVYFRCPHACMLNTQWKRYDVVSCKWNKGVECADMSQLLRMESCCGKKKIVRDSAAGWHLLEMSRMSYQFCNGRCLAVEKNEENREPPQKRSPGLCIS